MKILKVPSPNHYAGHSEEVSLIGIHTTENDENEGMALAVANYFAKNSTRASAHWVVDDATRVRCVDDEDSAWAMPPTNHYSLNIEQVGRAAQSAADWKDPYSLAVLDNAAAVAADWCKKFDIPVRHLTDDQIRNKAKGFAGHVDVNRVFGASDHTDPGPHYPWDYFLGLVNKHLGGVVIPVMINPNCSPLQKAVRCFTDNSWGAITDQHCSAVISATSFGGNKFPFGTNFTQACVGTVQDGYWGPKSQTALVTTVRSMQLALVGMGFPLGIADGIWGPKTQAAYDKAREACHI